MTNVNIPASIRGAGRTRIDITRWFQVTIHSVSRSHSLLLFLILALAFLVRISTVRYGLPFSYQEQEQRIVNIALRMGATHDLDPHFVGKGLLWYLLLAEFGVYYVIGRAAGIFGGAFDFAKSYFVDHSPFYLIDRTNQAVLAMLSIWAVYCLGRRFLGERGGLWAAAIGAFTAYHVDASRYAIVDLLNALFGALCLIQLARYDEEGTAPPLAWASIFAALSCSAKLPGGILIAAVLALALMRRRFRHVVAAVLIFGLAVALTTPAVFLSPGTFFAALREELGQRLGAEAAQSHATEIVSAFKSLLLTGLTLPGLFLLLAGLRHPLGSRAFKWLGLVLPSVVYLLRMGHHLGPNYFLVLWPAITLILAAGVAHISKWRPGGGEALGALVLASHLAFLPGSEVLPVISNTRNYLKPVPAHQTIEWIKANVPRGARIAVMSPGTWKGRLFPMPEELRARIERFKNIPNPLGIDYNIGNEQMYEWISKIVETDTAVPAYRFLNLDVETRAEQASERRRESFIFIEQILPFEAWSDVERLEADYFLFIDGMDRSDGRLVAVSKRLQAMPLASAYPPFYLYRLTPRNDP